MTPSDIAAALDAVPADPWTDPPRGRARGVGGDPLLEHRIARIVYATGDDLDTAMREAWRDYPTRGPGMARILDTLRLLGVDIDRQRAAWARRAAAV